MRLMSVDQTQFARLAMNSIEAWLKRLESARQGVIGKVRKAGFATKDKSISAYPGTDKRRCN